MDHPRCDRREGAPPGRATPRALALAAAALASGACSGTPRIEVRQAEARLSTSFSNVCSIFLRIENPGDGADALVRAAVDAPGAIVELHDFENGRMLRRERVRVAARSVVELVPGGLHIMVFNLPKDRRPGQELTLRLVFETSGEKVTTVRIPG
jgi:copper(I)-binding protein